MVRKGRSETLQELELATIRDALLRHEGNRTRAAAQLGIDPSTLFRKIKQAGLSIPPSGRGAKRG